MEHYLHIFTIAAIFMIGVIIWFWDQLINRQIVSYLKLFSIFAILVFSLHLSAPSLLFNHLHSSQNQFSHHPCCMPQLADLPVVLILPAKPILPALTPAKPQLISPTIVFFNLHNKSPPA